MRDWDGVEIFTTDINDFNHLPLGAFNISGHAVVPFASDRERYVEALADVVARFGIDFIFPIHDEEIRVVSQARFNGALKVDAPRSSVEMILACTDKLRMSQLCADHGINSPVTRNREEFLQAPFYPVFVKPRRGVGSQGAHLIQKAERLLGEDSARDLVFQHVCQAPEVTVDVLVGEHGTIAVARERLEVKAGVCTKGRIWYSAELAEIADKISAAFNLKGLFCFQGMKQAGQWAVTDINPRSGGATAMTVSAGINLYEEYFLEVAGQADPARFAALRTKAMNLPETIVTRYYQEYAQIVTS